MVHLCNMKMSAASTRHKSKHRHCDIDVLIGKILASRKFDDLAEKIAEKAANKIMHIDAAPSPVDRATDGNENDNSAESTHEVNKKQSNREDVHKYEKTQLNDVELRKDFSGKIDPQAVMNATITLSENLQLKYKYFKKNALAKKVKINQDPLGINDIKEYLTKQNKTIGPLDVKAHNKKTEEPISNQSATYKNLTKTEKESIDEDKRSRDDAKNDDPKEDSKRNSEINESASGTDGETNDSNKKPKLEEQDLGHEQTVFREAQHSGGPLNKAIVQRVQPRAREDSFEENKVTSDYNPNGGIYRSKASDDNDDSSPEERSSKDQSSKEQSPEDPNSSKLRPVIRKEGDKLYTYVRAPEYEDYHEKLSKWQKEHPDNPADFMF